MSKFIRNHLIGGIGAATLALGAGSAMAASDAVVDDTQAPTPRMALESTPSKVSIGVVVDLDEAGKDDGEKFIYLKGSYGALPPAEDHLTLSGTEPDARAAQSGAEVGGLLGSFTPSHANLRLGFANSVTRLGKEHRGLDVALTSSLASNGGAAFDPMGVDLSTGAEFGQTSANLGFSVGYAGFNLGASYLSGEQGLDYGYRGYDVGLGYSENNWGTILGFSGIEPTGQSRGADLLGTQNQYTMRLGAFLQVSPGITVGARAQYHDYRLFDSEESQNRGEFFLNTNLHF